MCCSQATLLYGIWVTTSSLAFAAAAHHRTRRPFLAIDLILERRRSGNLQVTQGGPSVDQVPPEVWDVVKESLIVLEMESEEQQRMAELRCEECQNEAEHLAILSRWMGRASDPIQDWTTWGPPPDGCGACWDIVEETGIDLVGTGRQMKALLAPYGLTIAAHDAISEPENEAHDFDSLMPVVLPFRDPSSRWFPKPTAELNHEYDYAPAHSVATISPAIFSLPPNTERRFSSLIKDYHLEVVHKSDSEILPPRPPSKKSAGSADGDKEATTREGGAAKDEGEFKLGPAEPRWMLWSKCMSCE